MFLFVWTTFLKPLMAWWRGEDGEKALEGSGGGGSGEEQTRDDGKGTTEGGETAGKPLLATTEESVR